MNHDPTSNDGERGATCAREDCDDDAEFWLYHPDEDRWRRRCSGHVRQQHPSLEINAWLESGYASPVELGQPNGPPSSPPGGRSAAFRELVDRTMDWG